MTKIDIAFISDDGYALPTGVAISSIYQHRNLTIDYHVHIISSNISKDNLDRLKSLSTDGFVIDIVDASAIGSYEAFGRMKYAAHVSEAALYKFDLADIFPGVDKLLYLDGDILVRDSLEELFSIDVDGVLAAVVKDLGAETFPAHYNVRLGIKHNGYFNSGVMLLNLKRMREERIPDALVDYKLHGKNDFMDQDAFNVVFAERVKYISVLYNMGMSCWRKSSGKALSRYYDVEESSVEWFFRNAKILHLSAREKPWKYNNVYASEEWFAAFVASPFATFELHRTPHERGIALIENGCDYESLRYDYPITTGDVVPTVSVITPVYNAERSIVATVESLLASSFKECEFIFVDDGSTDSSLEILKRYQRLDSRIVVLEQKNSYAGVARNNGIAHAKGKYITFLDSDDYMRPTAISDFVARMEETGADIVVSSAYHYSDDITKLKEADWCLRREFLTGMSGISRHTQPSTLFQISAGAPWGKMFKRELLDNPDIRFPALPRAEDFYFTYLAFTYAENIAVLDKHTILYHNDAGSDSLENAKDRFPKSQLVAREMLFEKLTEIGLYDTLKQTFITNTINSYYYHLRTFKTGEAFEATFNHFRDVAIEKYGIDMSDARYFHIPVEYRYMKAVTDAKSATDFLHRMYKEEREKKGREVTKPTGTRTAEAAEIRKSWSYKIGRFITWLPRKIRAFFRAWRDRGFRYAMSRVSQKLSSVFKKKD